ncbi:type II toxin-antitoxin system PemK/MazF family toxin [Bacteroidota bacterium]
MKNFSKNDIILVKYPFSSLSSFKVRPAIIINAGHPSIDIIIVPLTSKTDNLLSGEFILKYWNKAGLNTASVVKRGIFTIENNLVIKSIGKLENSDARML